jgi:hypothetical protein
MASLLNPLVILLTYWLIMIVLAAFFLRLACSLCRAGIPSWKRSFVSVFVVTLLAYIAFDFTGYLTMKQPDLVPDEVNEQQSRVGVLGYIAQAGQDPVATVLREEQQLLVEDMDETRLSCPEADVAFSMMVGRGEEEHLLPDDEGAHLRVEDCRDQGSVFDALNMSFLCRFPC